MSSEKDQKEKKSPKLKAGGQYRGRHGSVKSLEFPRWSKKLVLLLCCLWRL